MVYMRVLSVNVSQAKIVSYFGRAVASGIFKEPVDGRVMVRHLNLDGDRQIDTRVHGGLDKAVYAYPFEHYATWQEELGVDDFEYGRFGENFTTEGLLEDAVCIGDRFRVGGALLEVSQPRVPCFKLGMTMGMKDFPKRFIDSQRSGFYMRVIEEGEVGEGDAIEKVSADPEGVTVKYIYNLYFDDKGNAAEVKRMLELPALSGEWKNQFREI